MELKYEKSFDGNGIYDNIYSLVIGCFLTRESMWRFRRK